MICHCAEPAYAASMIRMGFRLTTIANDSGLMAVQAGHGTFNSRSMPVGGSAVHVCAGRIVEKAKKIAAQMMEIAAQDIAFDGEH
jgi:CO/xanthine dehydrogenase Mo-binding subunit